MDITEISDRMELEKLVTDYATAVDTKNFQEFNNLFTKEQVGSELRSKMKFLHSERLVNKDKN